MAAVERWREKDPRGWHKSANAKLLAALHKLVLETIPEDPTRPEYRQGGTLGRVHPCSSVAVAFGEARAVGALGSGFADLSRPA